MAFIYPSGDERHPDTGSYMNRVESPLSVHVVEDDVHGCPRDLRVYLGPTQDLHRYLRRQDQDDIPLPPGPEPRAPVEDPPDSPQIEPPAPVREPEDDPDRRLAAPAFRVG